MMCERYWREGISLVETGQPDPHRATCEDCRRAHESRHELVRLLPQLDAGPGDPHWQAGVWRQIAQDRKRWHAIQCIGGALAAACVVSVCWHVIDRPPASPPVAIAPTAPLGTTTHAAEEATSSGSAIAVASASGPRIEFFSGPIAKRTRSARTGDRVRISTHAGDDVRVYRAGKLLLRCAERTPAEGCTWTAQGLVAEAAFETDGDYTLVVATVAADPRGTMDKDVAAIIEAGGKVDQTDMQIR